MLHRPHRQYFMRANKTALSISLSPCMLKRQSVPALKEGDSVYEIDVTLKKRWEWLGLNEKHVNNIERHLWCVKIIVLVCVCAL